MIFLIGISGLGLHRRLHIAVACGVTNGTLRAGILVSWPAEDPTSLVNHIKHLPDPDLSCCAPSHPVLTAPTRSKNGTAGKSSENKGDFPQIGI
jgi:hypothetical protein